MRKLHSHKAIQTVNAEDGFGGPGQQDAHEFTQIVFLSLQRVEDLCTSKKAEGVAQMIGLNEVLAGTTHVTRTCTVCKARSTAEDAWNILTLHVSPSSKTLSDCFDNINKKQTLDGDDMVSCQKCKKRTKTTEQSRLMSATEMLVVHLNLFVRNKTRFSKLRRTVDIPLTHDVKLYSPTKKRYKKDRYELTAAVMHHGASTNSGHYTCYVRIVEGQWFLCNDERVSPVQENKLPFLHGKKTATSNAYLLFFSKA